MTEAEATLAAAAERAAAQSGLLARFVDRQFASLRTYNYRVFFFGQAISLVGTWMQTVGQGWLILRLTGSASALGLVTMLQFLPFTVLSLVGGVLADRLPKRKTLVIVQTLATCQAATLAALVATGSIQIWHVYVLAFVLGCTNAIERPTRQAFFSELVPRESLMNAVALNSSILNLARILGPALGGVVVALAGEEATFTINAFSFLAVLAGYALMRPGEMRKRPAQAQQDGMLRSIADGLRYAWGTPPVLFTLILVAFIGTFGYNFNVVVPLVAKFLLHSGPGEFGLLTSFLGFGSLVSAFAIAGARSASRPLLLVCSAVFSVVLFLFGLSNVYWVSALLLGLLGISGVALMTSANTGLQLGAPEHLRGRIVSIFILLQAGSTPIGGFMAGYLSDLVGVGESIAIQAVCCGAGVTVAALYLWRMGHESRTAGGELVEAA